MIYVNKLYTPSKYGTKEKTDMVGDHGDIKVVVLFSY